MSAEIQNMKRTSFFFSLIPTTTPSTQVQTCLLELFVSAIDLRQSFAQRGFSWAFSWYSPSHYKTWLIAIKPPNLFEIRKIDRSVLRMGKKIRGEQNSLEIGNWMKFGAGLYFSLQKHYFISISTVGFEIHRFWKTESRSSGHIQAVFWSDLGIVSHLCLEIDCRRRPNECSRRLISQQLVKWCWDRQWTRKLLLPPILECSGIWIGDKGGGSVSSIVGNSSSPLWWYR